MERTKKVESDIPTTPVVDKVEEKIVVKIRPRLKYRVLNGSLRIFKKAYRKGDIIEAYPEEIPKMFMDKVFCISDEVTIAKTVEDVDKPGTKEDLYTIIAAAGVGWYDVINVETKKAINEKGLRLPAAETLRNTLNA